MESAPFAGVVLCCTSIPVDLRTDVAEKVTELGGIHKNDLTHEVTHLIVGDYNTPKYRHVAYERFDIKAMCIGWVDAVRGLWTQDLPIDMAALEAAWQMKTFEVHGGFPTGGPDGTPIARGKLLCSITGFGEEERQAVISTIVDNGGTYNGDLTRAVTHLIVNKPEGKKYAAAMHWNIKTVSVEWLRDCVARGMILDESKYDPRLPPEERGKGATRPAAERNAILGKRLRESTAAAAAAQVATAAAGAGGIEKNGQRKLRKTASRKLLGQRDDLWGHILGKPGDAASASPAPEAEAAAAAAAQWQPPPQPARTAASSPLQQKQKQQPQQQQQQQQQLQPQEPPPLPTAETGGVLSTSIFYIHGFSRERAEVLAGAVATMGGHIAPSLEQMAVLAGADAIANANGGHAAPRLRQHVIVPQASQPSSHPTATAAGDDDVLFVTEFFIEKCLHKKQYALPANASNRNPPLDGSIIGMPFPVFPLPGYETLAVCTSGFTGVDLNQVDKTVRQLGATYQERFTAQCAVLVVTSLPAVRKQKLELALQWKVPVVYAKWLWASIAAGAFVSVEPYLFPQLRQQLAHLNGAAAAASRKLAPPAMALTVPTLVMPSPHTVPPRSKPAAAAAAASRQNRRHTGFEDDDDDDDEDVDMSSAAAPFETAPTHNDAPSAGESEAAPAPLQASTAGSNGRGSMSPPKRDPTPQAPAPAPAPPPAHKESAPTPIARRPQPRQPLDRVASEIADSDDPGDSGDEDRPAHDRRGVLSRAASAVSTSAKTSDAATHPPPPPPPQPAAPVGLQRSSTVAVAAPSSSRTAGALGLGKHRSLGGRPPLSRVMSEGLAAAPSVVHVHHPHVPIDISLGDLMKDSGQHAKARGGGSGSGSGGGGGGGGGGTGLPSRPNGNGPGGAIKGMTDGGTANGLQPADDDTPSQSQSLLPPTQVQVQYLDPEADRIHEQLMRKIRGGDAPAGAGAGAGAVSDNSGQKENTAPLAVAGKAGEAGLSRRRSSRLR